MREGCRERGRERERKGEREKERKESSHQQRNPLSIAMACVEVILLSRLVERPDLRAASPRPMEKLDCRLAARLRAISAGARSVLVRRLEANLPKLLWISLTSAVLFFGAPICVLVFRLPAFDCPPLRLPSGKLSTLTSFFEAVRRCDASNSAAANDSSSKVVTTWVEPVL